MRYFNLSSRDYAFIDKIEAGLVLTGSDVKSLRCQPPQFANSKVEIVSSRPVLEDLFIPVYRYSQGQVVDTSRSRQLLLSPRQISQLISYRHQKYFLIPIAIFLKGKWFKVEIGIGRKLRKYEKREKIKARETKKNFG